MVDKETLARWNREFGEGSGKSLGINSTSALRERLSPDGKSRPPYSGFNTLLGASLCPDAPALPNFADIDIALLGVPLDIGVSNRAGARHGPRSLRTLDRLGPFSGVSKSSPFEAANVADIGDIAISTRHNMELALREIEEFQADMMASGVRSIAVGGEHTITYPILKALGKEAPVGMVHFDAHCDLSGASGGTMLHHGAPFRNAVLAGVLDPERTIQIGIRGSASAFTDFADATGITVVRVDDIEEKGIAWVIDLVKEVIGTTPAYLSFDIDAMDPTFAPGTGTPEVGGLTPREAFRMMRGLEGLDIIGGDIVEVAPQYDPTSNTANLAAHIMFEILSLMVAAPSFSKRES